MTASVIIPTLNEIGHIAALLDHLLAEPADDVGEILVADGGSIDGTREVVAAMSLKDDRVRLIDNPDRIQSAGINRAVASGDRRFPILVRVDAHAGYPVGYVGWILRVMAETDADSVVVRMDTVGRNCVQRAIAMVSNSRIGTGGSAHRMGSVSGFIDHGHHAGMRRAVFEHAGGYDPTFEANEDAELDYRIRLYGGRIWFAADIVLTYVPRSTLTGLVRQYFRYGSGRARTFLKHGERLRVRQMLPPIALLGVLAGLLLAPLTRAALILPAGYVAIVVGAAIMMAVKNRSACALLAAPVLAVMHFAWGGGFIHRNLSGRRTVREPVRALPFHSEEPI